MFATRILFATNKGLVIWNLDTESVEKEYKTYDSLTVSNIEIIFPQEVGVNREADQDNYVCVIYPLCYESYCLLFVMDVEKDTCKKFIIPHLSNKKYTLKGNLLEISAFNKQLKRNEGSLINLTTWVDGSKPNFIVCDFKSNEQEKKILFCAENGNSIEEYEKNFCVKLSNGDTKKIFTIYGDGQSKLAHICQQKTSSGTFIIVCELRYGKLIAHHVSETGMIESRELNHSLLTHYSVVGNIDDEKFICSLSNKFIIVNADLSKCSKIFHLNEGSYAHAISKFIFPRDDTKKCHELLMPYISVKVIVDIIIKFMVSF